MKTLQCTPRKDVDPLVIPLNGLEKLLLKLILRPVPNLEVVRKVRSLKIMASSGLKGRNYVDWKEVLTGRLGGWTHEYKVYRKGSRLEAIGKLFGKRTGIVAELEKKEEDFQ